jgi:hypothetical protein
MDVLPYGYSKHFQKYLNVCRPLLYYDKEGITLTPTKFPAYSTGELLDILQDILPEGIYQYVEYAGRWNMELYQDKTGQYVWRGISDSLLELLIEAILSLEEYKESIREKL